MSIPAAGSVNEIPWKAKSTIFLELTTDSEYTIVFVYRIRYWLLN